MGLIEDFIARYRKEYDFYEQVARLVAQTIELNLQSTGIRSIVTSRAKSVVRLEAKVKQRAFEKNYQTVEQIFDDIVDLAGVRVALYFPAERAEVDKLIAQFFVPAGSVKNFPMPLDHPNPVYNKRFSGYCATHYRISLKEATLNEVQKRYAEARVEIQVASVLMHAWSEVEHDLAYKPLEGQLLEEEYAILDELNGLVIAGEIALERLQKAGETRVLAADRQFRNHYELAAYIVNRLSSRMTGPLRESALGRIDLLFDLLQRLNFLTPTQLDPYLEVLHTDLERRPLSEQIIDGLLAEDDSRYKTYEEIRASKQASVEPLLDRADSADDFHEALGFFMSKWADFEKFLSQQLKFKTGNSQRLFPLQYTLKQLGLQDSSLQREIDQIRRLRNEVVHGIAPADPVALREAGQHIQEISKKLAERFGQP
jgi:ppGpp synthetase/RelA/SpoT-type nucleotidyltranferase